MEIEVKRRNPGQWYVHYVDPNEAIDGQTELAVLHTTHWTGGSLYFDPNPHPIAEHTNANKNARKLEGIAQGRIVVMQVDRDQYLRASGEYEGEFRVTEAKIASNGSHALILQRTDRGIVIEH